MKHLLREGTAEAESILRCFTRNNLQHPTYKALSELGKACRTIFLCRYTNTERVARHWEIMLRVAGSLKLSTITAPELIRSLLKSDRPSGLTKAIGDLGRIAKTIHLLRYLDDESYRRRILVQLNRGEAPTSSYAGSATANAARSANAIAMAKRSSSPPSGWSPTAACVPCATRTTISELSASFRSDDCQTPIRS